MLEFPKFEISAAISVDNVDMRDRAKFPCDQSNCC